MKKQPKNNHKHLRMLPLPLAMGENPEAVAESRGDEAPLSRGDEAPLLPGPKLPIESLWSRSPPLPVGASRGGPRNPLQPRRRGTRGGLPLPKRPQKMVVTPSPPPSRRLTDLLAQRMYGLSGRRNLSPLLLPQRKNLQQPPNQLRNPGR